MNTPSASLPDLLARFRTTSIAEASGVTQPTVSQWKSGATFPSAEKFELLARFLGVDVSDLVRLAVEHKNRIAA